MENTNSQQCGDGNSIEEVDICQILDSVDRNSSIRQKTVQETSQNLTILMNQSETNRTVIERNLEILKKRRDTIQNNMLEMRELSRILKLKIMENEGMEGKKNGENMS